MTEENSVQKTEKNYSTTEIRARRKWECALGYRLFAAHRWGDLGDGHISARDPEKTDCFWMLRWGVSYHAARVADLVLVGPDGSLVEGEGNINIAGYYIHHPILEARPDLVSAVHVHSGWGSPFSAEAVGRFVYMERVAELHMKAHDPKPISAEAARFAKADLIRMGIGRQGFLSLLRRHIPDPDVVN